MSQMRPFALDVGAVEESPNSLRERFRVLSDVELRTQYDLAAKRAGIRSFGPQSELSPIQVVDQLQIHTDTATHPDIPVVLNADIPRGKLIFYFQDAAFIRRLSCEVTGLRLLGVGQPEPGFFGSAISPLDYIYVKFRRDGAGQVYQSHPITLSQAARKGGYFWDLVPAVDRAERIIAELSIVPPEPNAGGTAPTTPPFVERVGWLQIAFHCERFNPFGD